MSILIIAEHHENKLHSSTYPVLSAAKALGLEIDLLLIGSGLDELAKEASSLPYLRRVLLADNKVYQHQLAENAAPLITSIANNYEYILMPSTTFGKNILPRVAGLLDVSMLSDVSQIISSDTFARPMYAGNVLATVQTTEKIKLLTIRTTAFDAVVSNDASNCPVEKLDNVIENTLSTFESHELTQSERPELTSAKIVISGGRALKSAENFKMIEQVADQLGAAVGASRAAVDAGFVSNDYQVGQTGKVVAPEIYIAVGISGAIQHLAGMKDSKMVVAINNDPEAPIFEESDYIFVGDLFKILPELVEELSKGL